MSTGHFTALVKTASSGAIIPYASGDTVSLATSATGLASTGAIVSFGHQVSGVDLTAGTIDLSGSAFLDLNKAFSIARTCALTDFNVFFSVASGTTLSGTGTVSAQLYQSTTPDNTFSAIAGSLINLTPVISGTVASGTILTGVLNGLNIAFSQKTRLLLVISLSSTGTSSSNNLIGYVSGGANLL